MNSSLFAALATASTLVVAAPLTAAAGGGPLCETDCAPAPCDSGVCVVGRVMEVRAGKLVVVRAPASVFLMRPAGDGSGLLYSDSISSAPGEGRFEVAPNGGDSLAPYVGVRVEAYGFESTSVPFVAGEAGLPQEIADVVLVRKPLEVRTAWGDGTGVSASAAEIRIPVWLAPSGPIEAPVPVVAETAFEVAGLSQAGAQVVSTWTGEVGPRTAEAEWSIVTARATVPGASAGSLVCAETRVWAQAADGSADHGQPELGPFTGACLVVSDGTSAPVVAKYTAAAGRSRIIDGARQGVPLSELE